LRCGSFGGALVALIPLTRVSRAHPELAFVGAVVTIASRPLAFGVLLGSSRAFFLHHHHHHHVFTTGQYRALLAIIFVSLNRISTYNCRASDYLAGLSGQQKS
jgi:hypothetical protein